ncbi:hypothetical protein EDC01DRAFT_654675 [Geopyxis carbonaria]|nr:hypothetical protein EDC01DRAFT_654675 [Geopyxis carbonaria]
MEHETTPFYKAVREQALLSRPDELLQKREDGKLIVAIYKEIEGDKDSWGITDEDFIWIVVNPTTKLGTIHKRVKQDTEDTTLGDDFKLLAATGPITPDMMSRPVQSLDIHNDGLIVFRAIQCPDPEEYPPIPHISPPMPHNSPPMPHNSPKNHRIKQDPGAVELRHPHNQMIKPEPENRVETPITNVQLQDIVKDVPIQVMEDCIQKGLVLLDKLKQCLSNVSPAQAERVKAWVKQIDLVKNQAEIQPTIVGVVGNTGSGKSSLINALLDEERLVPTNCMRACTAVVTEISYNNETEARYRAKIEFITPADWQKELAVLFQDLLDESGKVKRTTTESDAGIAWAKIKAVYPRKTKDQISDSSIAELLNDRSVSTVLGTTKVIEQENSMRFYKQLQRYVDSQEKPSLDGEKKPKEMEFWPLVKVVKIYIRSPVLKTGAVVVDLPGVQDANAARAAVAEGYMKKCTGLWIVAPITRAVDDKTAHKLMGDGFRRQLLMDGGFSSLSFICSKSDDISVSEAMLSLNLDEALQNETTEIDKLDAIISAKKRELRSIKDQRELAEGVLDDLETEQDTWQELQEGAKDGKTVYAPKEKKRKRSRSTDEPQNVAQKPKKARYGDSDDEDFIDDEEEREDSDKLDQSASENEETRVPLTTEEIDQKLETLKTTIRSGRENKKTLTSKLSELKSEISELEDQIRVYENKRATVCIAARNSYSSKAIQNDFAAGLEELDQEAAEERDAQGFDPNAELRDYEAVASSLPVFCVSSRGYQKLQGRLRRDGDPPVFQNIEQTGMPSLQAHCTKLTEKGRLATGRKFLTSISQLCNSLALWSSDAGHSPNGIKGEDNRKWNFDQLDENFEALEMGINGAVESTITEVKSELENSIFNRYEEVLDDAAEVAPHTAEKWGRKVDRSNPPAGGYYWSTYKAIVRRNGAYTNGNGHHNFNERLAEPVVKAIATNWERVFARRVPSLLNNFAYETLEAIARFHDSVCQKAGPHHAARLDLLAGQITTWADALKSEAAEILATIHDAQREVSRSYIPQIEATMHRAYRICTQEVGPGQFVRMKDAMAAHVEAHKRLMFEHAASEIRRQLLHVVKDLRAKLEQSAVLVFDQLATDYQNIFADPGMGGAGDVEGRSVMAKVRGVLAECQRPFVAAVNGEVWVEPERVEPEREELREEPREERVRPDVALDIRLRIKPEPWSESEDSEFYS